MSHQSSDIIFTFSTLKHVSVQHQIILWPLIFTRDIDTADINAVCPAGLINFGGLPSTFSQDLMGTFWLLAQHPFVKIHLSSMDRQAKSDAPPVGGA